LQKIAPVFEKSVCVQQCLLLEEILSFETVVFGL